MICCPSFTISAWSNVKAPEILHKPSFQGSGPCNTETDVKKCISWKPLVLLVTGNSLTEGRKGLLQVLLFLLQLPQVASYWERFIFKDLSKSKCWRFMAWFYNLLFTTVWSISNSSYCWWVSFFSATFIQQLFSGKVCSAQGCLQPVPHRWCHLHKRPQLPGKLKPGRC